MREDSESRPARGAWVEIFDITADHVVEKRRAPQGARGLKFAIAGIVLRILRRRAPQGARGLK